MAEAGHSGSNWTIYHEQFFGGMTETLEQQVMAFNAASQNALRLQSRRMRGHFEQEAFLKQVSGLISRRDIGSVATVDDTALATDEEIGVKINRKIGPVANTLDSWKKIAEDAETMSLLLGRQIGPEVAADYLNTVLIALQAAVGSVAALSYDETTGGTTTMQSTSLIDGLALFGDAASRIIAWVMHSKPFFDLMKDQAANYKIDRVAGATLYEGSVATLSRPVIVTDSSALQSAGTPYDYYTLGLVADAAMVDESEDREMESELVTGHENLIFRMQGEYAFNVRLKGFAYDTTAGTNPSDATLGTGGNWTQKATQTKSLPGVMITTT